MSMQNRDHLFDPFALIALAIPKRSEPKIERLVRVRVTFGSGEGGAIIPIEPVQNGFWKCPNC